MHFIEKLIVSTTEIITNQQSARTTQRNQVPIKEKKKITFFYFLHVEWGLYIKTRFLCVSPAVQRSTCLYFLNNVIKDMRHHAWPIFIFIDILSNWKSMLLLISLRSWAYIRYFVRWTSGSSDLQSWYTVICHLVIIDPTLVLLFCVDRCLLSNQSLVL